MGLTCKQTVFPTLEQPGFDGIDHSCDGFDRYGRPDGTALVRYVGSGSTGTTINQAITDASVLDCGTNVTTRVDGINVDVYVSCDVFLQEGSHTSSTTINLIDGISIFGGLPAGEANWKVNPSSSTPVVTYNSDVTSTTIQASSNSGAMLGMLGENITSDTYIFGVEIRTVDLPLNNRFCAPNVAFLCDNCSGLQLRGFSTRAGRGGAGAAPGNPNGANGGNGNAGNIGEFLESSVPTSFIPGGFSPAGTHGGTTSCSPTANTTFCFPSHPDMGVNSVHWNGGTVFRGFNGHGVLGGLGADFNSPQLYGGPGGGGTPTAQAAPLDTYGVFAGLSPHCTFNNPGSTGLENHGSGGGGSVLFWHKGNNPRYFMGVSGAGGGQAGFPGLGGGNGAPSIGMVLLNSGPPSEPMTMEHVHFRGGAGGNGTPGGAGGRGGQGGPETPYSNNGSILYGGAGGWGAGGNGGNGGNGGASIGLMQLNSTIGSNSNSVNFSGVDSFQGGTGGPGGSKGLPNANQLIDHDPRTRGDAGNDGNSGLPGLQCNRFTPDTAITSLVTLEDLGCFDN